MKGEPLSTSGLPLSARAQRAREQPISYLIALALHNPRLINFAAGLVDPLTLPVPECQSIAQRLFCDVTRGRAALQYGTTLGLPELRHKVLQHLEQLEGKPAAQMGLTPDHILLSTGSQQALYLISDVLLDPGDLVIAANPTYFVYTGVLSSLGATVLPVKMDQDGMDVDELERLLERLSTDGRLRRLKLVYCVSYFDNPTGLTLSLERRRRMVQVIRRYSRDHRILILEDAAYRELRYDGVALASIKSFDPDNRCTILTQTFSKAFSPGLKCGYTAMPGDLMQAVVQQKGSHDFGSGNLTQHILAEAMRDGSYHRHVQQLCESYRAKRDAMLAAIERHMPRHPALSWTRPGGGLYVWITLPQSIDTSRDGKLFGAALESGVLYVPGDYSFQPDQDGYLPRHHLRLSFGQVALEQIEPGIKRLASVIEPMLASAVVGGRVS